MYYHNKIEKQVIKSFFDNIHYFNEKIKQIWSLIVPASVPPELETQFDQIQLKNSLYRLKIFGIITVFFNLLNWSIFILPVDEIGLLLYNKLFLKDLFQFFITFLFFLFTGYFSRKDKQSVLWFMCYLFIMLHYLLLAYNMLFDEKYLFLQIFFAFTFLLTFVPDFKPKIFISFLIFWYFTLVGLLKYKNQLFLFGGPHVLFINIFIIALVRIFYYNSKVKTTIDTFRINTLNERLEALSITDELTKLNNRRSFLDYMDVIWKQGRRLQLPVNVLMIDVDYFKKYNDSLGHLEGDKALIAVSQCMKAQIKRDTDFVARFGGEEFVCLLPYIEKENALNFANELVQSVENMKIYHPMSECSKYVTVSIGMASIIPDERNSQTKLLDEADKALYEAKHTGRNKVALGG